MGTNASYTFSTLWSVVQDKFNFTTVNYTEMLPVHPNWFHA